MTERKAKKILADYLEAELQGNDEQAELLETQLNEAGWKITSGENGLTVIRENKDFDNVDLSLLPTNSQNPKSIDDNEDSSYLKPILITSSVIAFIILSILLVRFLKQRKVSPV